MKHSIQASKHSINPIFAAIHNHNPHNIPTDRINSVSERSFLIEALREAPAIRLHEVGKALGVYQ